VGIAGIVDLLIIVAVRLPHEWVKGTLDGAGRTSFTRASGSAHAPQEPQPQSQLTYPPPASGIRLPQGYRWHCPQQGVPEARYRIADYRMLVRHLLDCELGYEGIATRQWAGAEKGLSPNLNMVVFEDRVVACAFTTTEVHPLKPQCGRVRYLHFYMRDRHPRHAKKGLASFVLHMALGQSSGYHQVHASIREMNKRSFTLLEHVGKLCGYRMCVLDSMVDEQADLDPCVPEHGYLIPVVLVKEGNV
jgi:hypothetical protein